MDRAQQPLRDEHRGTVADQLAAHLRRAAPVAAVAQHVDHARHARELRAGVAAGTAEVECGGERILRAPVVGRVVEHDAEPLVELCRDRREVVLEREREPAAHDLQSLAVLAVLRGGEPLDPERADAQVEPPRGIRLLARRARELDRVAVPGGQAQVVGHRKLLHRRLGRPAVRRVGLGCDAPRSERRLPFAAQLVDRREAALRVRHRDLLAGGPPDLGDLPPGARGLGEVAGEVAAAPVAREHLEAPALLLVLGPQVEHLTVRRRRVAVGVHGLGFLGRAQQRLARA